MKEKIIVGIIFLLVLTGAIFTVVIIRNEVKEEKELERLEISQEPVTDDCTREYEIAMLEDNIEEASSLEDKVSYNSALVLKKYYKECGHTINEYAEMLPELVNMTQEEISDEFRDWELIGFNSREVTLLKEFEGTCGEHFLLKEENGLIVIYKSSADVIVPDMATAEDEAEYILAKRLELIK